MFLDSIVDRGVVEKVTNLLITAPFGSTISLLALDTLVDLSHYKSVHAHIMEVDVYGSPVFAQSKHALP